MTGEPVDLATGLGEAGRPMLGIEVCLVLLVSLGASALYAIVQFAQDLASSLPLSRQSAVLNPSAVGNQWFNLVYQILAIGLGLAPAALAGFMILRRGEALDAIGLTRRGLRSEVLLGAALAAAVGSAGLALYLAAFHAGLSTRVVPTTLPDVWWRIPVLVASAVQNGVLEEVVVNGYLIHRLDQMGRTRPVSLVTSSLLRGAYHLYQGVGALAGNFAMGLLFGSIFQRRRRLISLIVAHALIDTGAFVGYVLLHGRVSWIP